MNETSPTLSEADTQGEDDANIYLKRVSRELDRFVIALMEIETASVALIEHAGPSTPMHAFNNLQRIDYLMQCSTALSAVLAHIAIHGDQGVSAVVDATRPADLSARLRDKDLEDIDNVAAQTTIF